MTSDESTECHSSTELACSTPSTHGLKAYTVCAARSTRSPSKIVSVCPTVDVHTANPVDIARRSMARPRRHRVQPDVARLGTARVGFVDRTGPEQPVDGRMGTLRGRGVPHTGGGGEILNHKWRSSD